MAAPLVLVVDDFLDGRELVAELLEHHGYRTLQARDGAEAVQMTIEHRPDLVLMDLCLPIIDGFEATRMIHQDPRTCRTPVIAITGHATQAVLDRALDAGCVRAFVKPCEPTRLVAAVREGLLVAA